MKTIDCDFYGVLKQKINDKKIQLEYESKEYVSFKDLISNLVQKYQNLKPYFTNDLEPKNSIIIIINGTDARAFGNDIPLKKHNKISFIPTIHGG